MVDYNAKYHKEKIAKPIFDRILLQKLWRYIRPYQKWIIFAVLLLIIGKLAEASIPLMMGKVTQGMLDGSMGFETILETSSVIFAVLFFSYATDAISVGIKTWYGLKGIVVLRSDIYRHIILMPLSFYDRNPVGRLITRTIHDVDQINRMFAEGIVPILGNIVLFIGILIGVAFLDWRAALVMCFLFPVAIFHTNYFRVNQRRCFGMIRTIVSALNTFVQEHLMGFTTIRNFGLQREELRSFEEMNQDHADAYKETISYYSFFYAGIDFIQSSALLLLFTLLVLAIPQTGEFQAGTYFAFSIYVMMIFRPLSDLAERYNELQAAFAAAERIFDVFEQPDEILDASYAKPSELEEIAFEGIWFAYKDEDWVLKDVSFNLKKGESLGIVGVTGSGKTTIMSLLLRFYEPQKGKITINGSDIRNYSKETLRSFFGVVLQDPVIFSGTIKENLTLNDPHIHSDAVEQVVKELELSSFINRYPKGLEEPITSHGKGLSVGEMQLISMARVLVHRRQVMMLDEATANIDTRMELLIQEGIKRLTKQTTSIIIAHRLSTIREVDRILVMHEGRIAEQGTHKSLLEAKGLYEKLYRLHFHAF